MAFGASDWRPEIIQLAKDSGTAVYAWDWQGSTDNPASWQEAIHVGADGIQTDRPGQLVRYLREKGLQRVKREAIAGWLHVCCHCGVAATASVVQNHARRNAFTTCLQPCIRVCFSSSARAVLHSSRASSENLSMSR